MGISYRIGIGDGPYIVDMCQGQGCQRCIRERHVGSIAIFNRARPSSWDKHLLDVDVWLMLVVFGLCCGKQPSGASGINAKTYHMWGIDINIISPYAMEVDTLEVLGLVLLTLLK